MKQLCRLCHTDKKCCFKGMDMAGDCDDFKSESEARKPDAVKSDSTDGLCLTGYMKIKDFERVRAGNMKVRELEIYEEGQLHYHFGDDPFTEVVKIKITEA